LEPLLPRQFRRQEARIPRFDWDEDPAGDWHTDLRRLSIYALEEGLWQEKDTDRGLNFLTVLAQADRSVRRYTALWIPPDSSPGPFLFQVRTATGKQFCSRPFTLAEVPSIAPVPPVSQAGCKPGTETGDSRVMRRVLIRRDEDWACEGRRISRRQTGYSQPIPKAGIGGSPRFAESAGETGETGGKPGETGETGGNRGQSPIPPFSSPSPEISAAAMPCRATRCRRR